MFIVCKYQKVLPRNIILKMKSTVLFLLLAVYTITGHLNGDDEIELSSYRTRPFGDWTLRLYTNEHPRIGLTDFKDADRSARTVIIIHGWQQRENQSWIIQMKDVYITQFRINVIVLDWSKDANSGWYLWTVGVVPEVGLWVGDRIYELQTDGVIHVNTLKVIGHSLGAHVAGYAGQRYQNLTNGEKLSDIVGLDAASPEFEFKSDDQRLDASDARMVQAFHTSTSGMSSRYGKVDVYFNYHVLFGGCGKSQPGCPTQPGVPIDSLFGTLFCEHVRSIAYYIESIQSRKFLAVPCTCSNFKANKCKNISSIIVGENLSPTAEDGEYYLTTTYKAPFALEAQDLQESLD
ncbi:hypothetical protein RI129_012945 [Pyrocoelia pectoralis]|uniref:Lipase domain-containing protein n=1 Tax=Pyrocoelia pectoralis TaxID=417401 RepID=A0AAN7UUY6_9COLE